VTDRDAIRPGGFGDTMQEIVPEATSGVLERQALRLRIGGNVDGLHGNRKTEACSQIAAKPFISRSGAPEAVIQVGEGDDGETVHFGDLSEQKHERDGVGSAGEADQQSRSCRTELVSMDRAANLVVKMSQIIGQSVFATIAASAGQPSRTLSRLA
jgi:hypothetical protein